MEAAFSAPYDAYAALFAVMLLSWAGLPVAGQPALVAAGVVAGQEPHRFHIVLVLVVATAGSAIGGMAGYWVGRRGGRALSSPRGPFPRTRRREMERGERLVERYGAVATFVVPMWVPGVYGMDWSRFVVWNLFAASAWTLVAGVGGYLFGPSIANTLGKLSTGLAVAIGAVVVVVMTVLIVRRRRSARQAPRSQEPRGPRPEHSRAQ